MFWYHGLITFAFYKPGEGSQRFVLFHITTPVWFSETCWDEKRRLAPVLWNGAPTEDQSNTIPQKLKEEAKPDAIKVLDNVLEAPEKHPFVLLRARQPEHFDIVNRLILKHNYKVHTVQYADEWYHITLVR